MQKVVRAGIFVMPDEKNPHFRHVRDGTMIKLDVNDGVCTLDIRICVDETGPVLSWRRRKSDMKEETELMVKKNQHRPTGVRRPRRKGNIMKQHTYQTKERGSAEKTHHAQTSEVRRISGLNRVERRQTSEHHEQCFVEEGSRRTVDN